MAVNNVIAGKLPEKNTIESGGRERGGSHSSGAPGMTDTIEIVKLSCHFSDTDNEVFVFLCEILQIFSKYSITDHWGYFLQYAL